MLKIGVLGTGHLGKIHLRCLREIPDFTIAGFYDPDPSKNDQVVEEFQISPYSGVEELINDVDVVDIVTPTVHHFDCAALALKKAKHVFIEKPIVATPEEAKELIAIAEEANVKVQVGHVERFNPAFLAAQSFLGQPMFIEAHRLSQFNPRGTDVPVVLDLMIHDIDIVLSVARSNIKRISASGVAVISETPDIANARLEFENGCVANLTASRISMKNMRKGRFFQRNTYISVDFLDKKVEVIRMEDHDPKNANPFALVFDLGEGKGSKQIIIEKPEVPALNAIKTELERFAEAIIHNTVPPVTIMDGYLALDVAYRILEKMNT